MGGLCLLAIALWMFRVPLLTTLADAWIVNDVPVQADAIVVLGGGVQYRPIAAARLYKKGLASKVLIMDVASSTTDDMDLTEPQKVLTRRVLLGRGVPANAIETVGRSVSNTADESFAVHDWAKQHEAKRLIIVTEIFHTRRARWIFRKRFRDLGTEIQMVAVDRPEYQASNWWRHENGLIAFQNEWTKMLYYRIKY
jgi:uncharacterized SAM-binding protein YcdF (DUF218 family)